MSGSELVCKDLTASVQFFYQQLDSAKSATAADRDVPLFTIVSVKDAQFSVAEVNDYISLSDSSLSVPTITVDITEINPKVFEKINVFSSNRKTAKRIMYHFKQFRSAGYDILLADNLVIFETGLDPKLFADELQEAGAKSLSLNRALVRPQNISGPSQLAFWIFQYAKQTERVFPPAPMTPEIEFKDCVFAKDILLV